MNRLRTRVVGRGLAKVGPAVGAGWVVVAVVVAGQGGCAGHAPGPNRPVVAQSAAGAPAVASAPSGLARELNFLDELESRALVVHDDALEAALLLGTGKGGAGSEERISAAVQLGYVDAGYNRPALEAATVGEVAQILSRVVRGGQKVTVEQAMADMVGRGTLPPIAKAYQGLTGAQSVSMIGGARDAMRSAAHRVPVPEVRPVSPASTPEPAPASSQPAEPENETANAAVSSTPAVQGSSDWSVQDVTITPEFEQPPAGSRAEGEGEASAAVVEPAGAQPVHERSQSGAVAPAEPAPVPVQSPAAATVATAGKDAKGRPEPLPDVALEEELPIERADARAHSVEAHAAEVPATEFVQESPASLRLPAQPAEPADASPASPELSRHPAPALSISPAAPAAQEAPAAAGPSSAAPAVKRRASPWVPSKPLKKTDEPAKSTDVPGGTKN